jgi:hypothetical protein
VTACGASANPKRVTTMVPAEGWSLRLAHSADCTSGAHQLRIVAWAATEMHGVQPICVSRDGAALDLLEDTLITCTDHCSARISREQES